MPRIVPLVVAACLLVTLAGCGGETVVAVDQQGRVSAAEGTHASGTDTPGTGVPGTESGAVSVPAGDQLVVDLGSQNSSIGDSWHLVTAPDPAVLSDAGQRFDSDCDAPGCGGEASWLFDTVGAGTTELTLRYCYRSRPPGCEPMPDRGPADPVILTVTVTAD